MPQFETTLAKSGSGAFLEVPFDPDEVWGLKEQHYVAGTINDRAFRGLLDTAGPRCLLPIGAAWIRDNGLGPGATVTVSLRPDGHQIATIAPDIAAALTAEPQARALFESVAPFYRNNYIRWIESAKRPETRAKRIAETVAMLKRGEKRL